jgi:hypothetical protein
MKLFTLAIDGKNAINFSGDLTLQEVKNIAEAIIYVFPTHVGVNRRST